jgi:hypothetical protein
VSLNDLPTLIQTQTNSRQTRVVKAAKIKLKKLLTLLRVYAVADNGNRKANLC